MDSCGFKVIRSGGEISCDYVEPVLSSMTEEAKLSNILHTAYCICEVKVCLNFNLGPVVK